MYNTCRHSIIYTPYSRRLFLLARLPAPPRLLFSPVFPRVSFSSKTDYSSALLDTGDVSSLKCVASCETRVAYSALAGFSFNSPDEKESVFFPQIAVYSCYLPRRRFVRVRMVDTVRLQGVSLVRCRGPSEKNLSTHTRELIIRPASIVARMGFLLRRVELNFFVLRWLLFFFPPPLHLPPLQTLALHFLPPPPRRLFV